MFYLHVEILHHGNLGLTSTTALYKRCPYRFTDNLRMTTALAPHYQRLPPRLTGYSVVMILIKWVVGPSDSESRR